MVATRLSAGFLALLLAGSARPSPGGADPAPILVHDDDSPPKPREQAGAAACKLEPEPIQTATAVLFE